MIQRIQSFYLVLAVCAMALCFMFPVATYEVSGDSDNAVTVASRLDLVPRQESQQVDMLNTVEFGEPEIVFSQKGLIATWPLAVVAGLCGLLSLVSIFLFSNRMRQVRVVACAFLLNVVYLFLVFVWAVDAFGEKVLEMARPLNANHFDTTFSVATWASVVSLLMLFLAQRAIKRDEAKVRAADRLR